MAEPTERHKEIVAAINSFAMAELGIGTANIAALKDVSLLEMIEASRALENDNKQAESVNGSKSFWVVPDDRLIAAVYAWMHYAAPPSHRPFEGDTAIVVARVAGHAHALVVCSRPVHANAANEDQPEEAVA